MRMNGSVEVTRLAFSQFQKAVEWISSRWNCIEGCSTTKKGTTRLADIRHDKKRVFRLSLSQSKLATPCEISMDHKSPQHFPRWDRKIMTSCVEVRGTTNWEHEQAIWKPSRGSRNRMIVLSFATWRNFSKTNKHGRLERTNRFVVLKEEKKSISHPFWCKCRRKVDHRLTQSQFREADHPKALVFGEKTNKQNEKVTRREFQEFYGFFQTVFDVWAAALR